MSYRLEIESPWTSNVSRVLLYKVIDYLEIQWLDQATVVPLPTHQICYFFFFFLLVPDVRT